MHFHGNIASIPDTMSRLPYKEHISDAIIQQLRYGHTLQEENMTSDQRHIFLSEKPLRVCYQLSNLVPL